ncbi:hypothetical protein M422DRAFT_247933 [Sphaerobolus stellatus SS14]|nr:hypothetical protein M422DRAFT_247933 [Sphaerobolus stellatus SS14]
MTGLEKEMSMGIPFWEGHVAEKWEEDAETAYEREVSFHRLCTSLWSYGLFLHRQRTPYRWCEW